MTSTHQSCFRFTALSSMGAFCLILAGCGGGSDPAAPVVTPPPVAAAALQMVGAPADANTVIATVCADPFALATVGRAATVRYPKSAAAFRGWPNPTGGPADYGTPMQMRSARAGGYVVSHSTDANGAMFQVAASGDKSVLPIPYASTFDVTADGSVWFVKNGTLSMATQDGKLTALASTGNGTAAVDGPLGASPLGPVTLIAAGKDKVYLLVEEATSNTTGTQSPVAFKRALRVLSRAAQSQGGWVVNTVPLWGNVQSVDVISAMRVGPTDELVVLVNEPFMRLLSQQQVFPGGVNYRYASKAWVRVLDAANNWTDVAGQEYRLSVNPNASHAYQTFNYDLDAKDLAIAPNGDIWVGGAGYLFKVGRAISWQLAAQSELHTTDHLGVDGLLATATFANASQLVADNAGVTLFDGVTCQIRRVAGGQIVTVSGPRLSGPHFAAARFIGQDAQGALLLANGTGYSDATRGSYLYQPALVKATIGNPLFVPQPVKSLAAQLDRPVCTLGTSYWAGPASCIGAMTAPLPVAGVWLGMGSSGVLARFGNGLFTGVNGEDPVVIERSSTTTWPGILNGEAPSGPSGVHVDGSKFYLFGWMRTDPPVALNTYHELRLYQLDTSTSAVAVVAGASIVSNIFVVQKIDLSPVIPNGGGGPAFVQHRSDGKFWLSNGKELWLLDTAGQLKRVAGLSISGGGVDGVGDGASFARVSSIRVLPDNRLLVVDQGAHAVRLLGDDGKVTTLVGKLNTQGASVGTLPTTLDTPVDAFAVGKDIYITTQTSRNLLLANGVL